MTADQATDRIRRRLIDLEHREAQLGGSIVNGPLTPMQRRHEIITRLDHLFAGAPNTELLEIAGAHLLAFLMTTGAGGAV